jgi:hypothetical protein
MTKLSVLLLMSCTAFSVGIANAASGLISMSDNELGHRGSGLNELILYSSKR